MATLLQSEQSLRYQLQIDAPQRLKQAGAGWKKATMGFYYGNTPHSEIAVDIGIRGSMLRLMQADNATLPPQIWNGLVSMINTNTVVSVAINTMRYATAHEIPIPPVG